MNMNKTLTALALTLQISFSSIAGQAQIDEIEQAAGTLNIEQLQIIVDSSEGYEQALAQYRMSLSANLLSQDELAVTSLNKSIEQLEQLDQATPNNPEIKALLAQVYGYKIALEPMKGMYYGPKSATTIAAAEDLAPNNPRVLLVKGIGKYNTPAIFGGSTDAAAAAFDKAIEAFNNDKASDYYWGHAEAYTWRGLVQLQQGNIAMAKQDWQHALEINPDYGWAQMLLTENN